MAYVYFCNNPRKKCIIGDCVIRALSCAMKKSWDTIYIDLVMEGFSLKDMPSSNEVWGRYLYSNRFRKYSVPDEYTIEDFANDHREGIYIVGTGTHVVAVIDGNYMDTWDSGSEIAAFYWEREEY